MVATKNHANIHHFAHSSNNQGDRLTASPDAYIDTRNFFFSFAGFVGS
jgi:hypothetical protein